MKKLKIAFFTDTYLPNKDGVVSSIINLKREFEKLGHKVYIFSPEYEKGIKRKNVFYYKAISFPPYPQYKGAVDIFTPLMKIRQIKPDIIHCHALTTMGVSSIISSKLSKIPSVATFHTMVPLGSHYISKNKKHRKIIEMALWEYVKFYLKFFDKITVPSKNTQKDLEKHNVKSDVYPNGINFSKFRRIKVKKSFLEKFGILDKKIVLHVGRIVHEKNIDILIRSAPYFLKRDVVVVVVGDGPAKEYYIDLVKKKGLEKSILFTGFLKTEELIQFYKYAKVLAFPSTFETQGLVALESMACGTPVVALKNTAVAEIVEEKKTGYISRKNIKEFAEKISMAIKNKWRMEKHCVAFARKYDIKKTSKKMLDLYFSLIKRKN